jgi:hypothetical protein
MQVKSADDRFAAFRHRSYFLFFVARFLAAFATQIISVAVGWQMYDVTKSTFFLGLIGLVQFLPSLMLILVTGSVTDRYNRRAIVSICLTISALCAAALLLLLALTACSGGNNDDEPGSGKTTDADCGDRIPNDVFDTLRWSPPKAAEITVRGCHRETEQGYVEVRDRTGNYDDTDKYFDDEYFGNKHDDIDASRQGKQQ